MINHIASQSQTTCELFFNIESKLWKVLQSQIELLTINFKFEAPILLQVQVITYIIYN